MFHRAGDFEVSNRCRSGSLIALFLYFSLFFFLFSVDLDFTAKKLKKLNSLVDVFLCMHEG